MASDQKKNPKADKRCARCRAALPGGEGYCHGNDLLCADCCMDLRLPLVRKTHWQYLGAIKRDFLRKAEED